MLARIVDSCLGTVDPVEINWWSSNVLEAGSVFICAVLYVPSIPMFRCGMAMFIYSFTPQRQLQVGLRPYPVMHSRLFKEITGTGALREVNKNNG